MTAGGFQGRIVIALTLFAALVVSAANAPSSEAASQAREANAAAGRSLTAADVRLTASTSAKASALAAAAGRPVEVMADRTDWTQVFAEPRGGFRMVESLVPVRVRRPDGSWAPVDTTLSVRPDGLVTPGAITTGLSLSNGGKGPLFTLSQGGHSLSVSWPFGALPAPSLSGPTATYPNVLPGVNLLMSATPTGVSDLVEVTSAAAAANPALARLTFPVGGSGLSVRADRQGNLTASDASGDPVFDAAAPRMWDSAGSRAPRGRVPWAGGALDGPVPGDHTAMLDVSVGAGSVSLRPAAPVLSGPSVVYPVFIDPTWNGHESDATWLDVWRNSAGSSGDWEPTSSTSGGIKSGVCPDGSCPNGLLTVYRSYINFTLPSGYAGSAPDYVDAQLQITEEWSDSCSPSTLELWQTNHASRGIDFNGRPQELTELASPYMAHGWSSSGPNGPSSCPAATVAMNATPALKAAGNPGYGSSTVTFELRASDTAESSLDPNSWKRFDANTMDLVLYWRHKPDVPTGAGTQGVFDAATGRAVTNCSGSQSAPDWVSTNAPVWQATIDDSADRSYDQANGAANEPLDGEFSWQNLTTGTSGTWSANQNSDSKGNNVGAPPGTQFTGKRSGTPGNEYVWRAYGATLPNVPTGIGNDTAPVLSGSSSSPCYFQPDQSAPVSAPTVSGPSSLPVGAQGTYTFTAGAQDAPVGGGSGTVNDVVGFYWGIDNPQPSTYVPASTIGSTASTATVTFIPFNTAEADIYVRAVDRAGNVGPVSPLFPVTATTPQGNIAELAWWRLNNNGLDSAVAAGQADANLTLSSSASFGCPGQATASPAGYTCSLAVDGSSGHALTGRPVMGNDGSFSVSAWADPAGCSSTSYCAVLSQGASTVSAFTLGYQASGTANGTSVPCPCWIFAMPKQDAAGGEYSPAGSSLGWNVTAWHIPSSALNTWTQLTGVLNASHNQLLLYVNGGDGLQHPGDSQDGDGNPAAAVSNVQPWTAGPGNGVFRIGADWTSAAGPADYFHGAVSDACVFYSVLLTGTQQPDVQRLYDQGPDYGQDSGDGCAALYSTYP